jgi:hypothetical protein
VFHGGEVGLSRIMHVKAELLDSVGDVRAGECQVLEGLGEAPVLSRISYRRPGLDGDLDLCVQVLDHGDVGAGVGIDGAIIVVVLGDNDPLGSSELLFQVTNVGLFLLPGEGGGTLTHTGLVQNLARSSHGGEESLLLSLCGGCGSLGHGREH